MKREILPDALYTAREVAALLGLSRPQSVTDIPERELVPTRVGPRRGRKMYRGRDLLRYLASGRPVGAPPLKEREVA